MGRVRGPYPQKKLRNLKDYSIASERATFFEGPTPLGPPSECPNIDENLSKMKKFFGNRPGSQEFHVEKTIKNSAANRSIFSLFKMPTEIKIGLRSSEIGGSKRYHYQ